MIVFTTVIWTFQISYDCVYNRYMDISD